MVAGVRDTLSTGRGTSVSLAGLEKRYDRVNAVAGVSLDIRSGEFLTLLGPSGSGKTTTLMMIAGFETPTAGDIAMGMGERVFRNIEAIDLKPRTHIGQILD